MNWKIAACLSPVLTGAGILAGAMVAAHNYQLRCRTIILPDEGNVRDKTNSDNLSCDNLTGSQNCTEKIGRAGTAFTPECETLRILHISDTHLTHRQLRRQNFLRSLAAQKPDLLVFTGDLIGENAAIEPLLAVLEVFRGTPGVYVYGSNDYHAPRPKNPLKYLYKNSSLSANKPPLRLDTQRLTAGLNALGFLNLNNATGTLSIGSWALEFIGVNDPHIGYAKFPEINFSDNSLAITSRQINQLDETKNKHHLRIGLTHAPYKDVLNSMQAAGCKIVFSGHTHGGQVCLPGHRALVTNCDLPKRYASGLFTWPIRSDKDEALPTDNLPIQKDGSIVGWVPDSLAQEQLNEDREAQANLNNPDTQAQTLEKMFVQVSAGLGTSPYAQIRTFCPPEAIQLDIIQI